MLAKLLSRPGHYGPYAGILAAMLFIYFWAGFLLVKGLLADRWMMPNLWLFLATLVGAALFARIHARSMSDLDRVRERREA